MRCSNPEEKGKGEAKKNTQMKKNTGERDSSKERGKQTSRDIIRLVRREQLQARTNTYTPLERLPPSTQTGPHYRLVVVAKEVFVSDCRTSAVHHNSAKQKKKKKSVLFAVTVMLKRHLLIDFGFSFTYFLFFSLVYSFFFFFLMSSMQMCVPHDFKNAFTTGK